MTDNIIIEEGEVDSFMHFLKACKAMSPRSKTDMLIGPRGISVRCGTDNWGFMGNLPKENMSVFEISRMFEFRGLDFDDIVKLKTKNLHQMVLNPDKCLGVHFRDYGRNDIFGAELCSEETSIDGISKFNVE